MCKPKILVEEKCGVITFCENCGIIVKPTETSPCNWQNMILKTIMYLSTYQSLSQKIC